MITLGQYPPHAPQPLVWRVLKEEEERMLLISERVIDEIPFHGRGAFTWETSCLRERLEEIAETAFSAEERDRILRVSIKTSPACHGEDEAFAEESSADEESSEDFAAEDASAEESPAVITCDRLFLLSCEEAATLFRDDEDRRACPTPYAVGKGSFADAFGGAGWWLRDRGYQVSYASDVLPDGSLCPTGEEGDESGGLRPALWLRKEK